MSTSPAAASPLRPLALVALYASFAAISIVANIGTQYLVQHNYHGALAAWLALFVGTGTGLAIKYALDKRYIFNHVSSSTTANAQTFVLYCCMGLVTTAIFWSSEIGAGWIFGTLAGRYIGGAVGLIIGYLAKFFLDKKFVFRVGTTYFNIDNPSSK